MGELKMIGKYLKLMLLGGILQPIIVKPTLANGHNLALYPDKLLLKFLKITLNTLSPLRIKRLFGPTWMYPNSRKAILKL
jgi:hypothetical protein